jgi:hypothetical protein
MSGGDTLNLNDLNRLIFEANRKQIKVYEFAIMPNNP